MTEQPEHEEARRRTWDYEGRVIEAISRLESALAKAEQERDDWRKRTEDAEGVLDYLSGNLADSEGGRMRPVPEISSEQENARMEPLAEGVGFRAMTIRRDPVEPVPVGTYVAMVFRVTGYDSDCDGSLMARLEQVDRHGEPSGWEPTHLGLYSDSDLIVQDPDELWRLADTQREDG